MILWNTVLDHYKAASCRADEARSSLELRGQSPPPTSALTEMKGEPTSANVIAALHSMKAQRLPFGWRIHFPVQRQGRGWQAFDLRARCARRRPGSERLPGDVQRSTTRRSPTDPTARRCRGPAWLTERAGPLSFQADSTRRMTRLAIFQPSAVRTNRRVATRRRRGRLLGRR